MTVALHFDMKIHAFWCWFIVIW